MLRPFAHPVACCWMLFAQSLKPVKLFSKHLPTFLLFRDRRSVAQQCWIRLHSSSNIEPRTLITHGLQRLIGCILPTMHCRSQHCWKLLRPFAHHCQHGCNGSQQCWDLQCILGRIQPISLCRTCVMSARGPNNVGRAVQTDPTLLR